MPVFSAGGSVSKATPVQLGHGAVSGGAEQGDEAKHTINHPRSGTRSSSPLVELQHLLRFCQGRKALISYAPSIIIYR